MLIFIPSTLLVVFFRCIQQHRPSKRISPVMKALTKLQPNERLQTTVTQMTIPAKKKKKKKRQGVLFPWWCVFIAYGVSLIMISVSIFLMIVRGIDLGDMKVRKWLGSLVIAFFSSVLLSQPIKVCFFNCFVMIK